MPRGRPRQFVENQVLSKALEAFWFHGFQGIGIQALLQHMGISRQSLYNTFGDKRRLFMAAMDYYKKNHLDPELELLNQPGSSIENIVAFAGAMCGMAQHSQRQGCFIANTIVEMGPHDPEIANKSVGIMGQIEKQIEACIARGQMAGEIKKDAEPCLLANSICTMVLGLAVASKTTLPKPFFESGLSSLRDLLRQEQPVSQPA